MNPKRKRLDFYIREHLLPRISKEGVQYQFEFTGRGQRSTVVYLTVEGMKPLVLKATEKRRKALQMAEGSRHLLRHGIKVPEVVYLDLSRRAFTQLGCYLVCEERIEGKVFEELDDPMEVLPLVAQTFARLHRIRRRNWGKIAGGRRYRFWHYVEQVIVKRLKVLETYSFFFPQERCSYYRRWFANYKQVVSGYKHFSLSHGDPHMHNVLISNEGEVYLLDNVSLRYLPWGIDFYKLQYHFCGENSSRIELWQDAYLSCLTEEERGEFYKSRDFFHCYVVLDFAHQEVLNPSPIPYPLSLKRARDILERITGN